MTVVVILGVLLAYLTAAVLACVWVTRRMRAKNQPAWKRLLAGGALAFLLYLVPFWDLVPVVLAHRYYCATSARFEVFKTPEQWKAENTIDAALLRPIAKPASIKRDHHTTWLLNPRIAVELQDLVRVFPAIRKEEARMVDVKTGIVIAQYVDYITGYGSFGGGQSGSWKFWLNMGGCQGTTGYRADFSNYEKQFAAVVHGDRK